MDYLRDLAQAAAVRRTVSDSWRATSRSSVSHLFERKGDTDRERLTDHPLARLLSQPNPWTTKYRFFNSLVMRLRDLRRGLPAEAKWVAGGSRQLLHLPPPMVEPKGDNWLTPDEFEFAGAKVASCIPAAGRVLPRLRGRCGWRGVAAGVAAAGAARGLDRLGDARADHAQRRPAFGVHQAAAEG
jgi:hypothetical protein